MALETAAKIILDNGFCLPTLQRRLRHLHGVAVRNLVYNMPCGDVIKLQTYFTLSHIDDSKVLYTSEKVTGSLNPTWQTFSLVTDDNAMDTSTKSVRLRVFAGTNDTFQVIIEYNLHLSALEYLTDQLSRDHLQLQPNTVIVSLFNKYFTIPPPHAPEKCIDVASAVINVETLAVRQTYSLTSLLRLKTVLRAIKQTQSSVTRIRTSIEDRLVASQHQTAKLEAREKQISRVERLRGELLWQREAFQSEKEAHSDKALQLHDRKCSLKDDHTSLRKQNDELRDKLNQHNHIRENYVKVNAQLTMRRKQLIAELATYIYPLCETPKGTTICGIFLPDSEHLPSRDEISIAVALGYASHLLLMMSQILDQSLWYRVHHNGSRSEITDHVMQKLPYKDRKFPLFWKGKEKLQFDYGVFLLNKNICQLRYLCGLGTTDLRPTLMNIKTLLEVRFGVRSDQPVPIPLSLPKPDRSTTIKNDNHTSESKGHNPHTDQSAVRLQPESDLQVHSNGTSPDKLPNIPSLSLIYHESVKFRDNISSSEEDLRIKPTATSKTHLRVDKLDIHRSESEPRIKHTTELSQSDVEKQRRGSLQQNHGIILSKTHSFESNGDLSVDKEAVEHQDTKLLTNEQQDNKILTNEHQGTKELVNVVGNR